MGRNKPLFVWVITICNETGNKKCTKINYKIEDKRRWLGAHCSWALKNNHSVFTTTSEEAKRIILEDFE